MKKINVNVALLHATSNREPFHYSTLRITDAANHHTIVEVQLTPEQVYNLMISREIQPDGTPAEVVDEIQAIHLGQRTNVFARTFQRDHDKPMSPLGEHVTQHPDLIAFAERMQANLWCHKYSWSMRHNSINLTLWRYETGLDEEAKALINRILQDETPPEGLK